MSPHPFRPFPARVARGTIQTPPRMSLPPYSSRMIEYEQGSHLDNRGHPADYCTRDLDHAADVATLLRSAGTTLAHLWRCRPRCGHSAERGRRRPRRNSAPCRGHWPTFLSRQVKRHARPVQGLQAPGRLLDLPPPLPPVVLVAAASRRQCDRSETRFRRPRARCSVAAPSLMADSTTVGRRAAVKRLASVNLIVFDAVLRDLAHL